MKINVIHLPAIAANVAKKPENPLHKDLGIRGHQDTFFNGIKLNLIFIAMIDTNQFNDEVYQVVSLVPKGRVTTYGAIARALGYGTARMVGHAMSTMGHQHKNVPAQRVVNSSGHISPLESSGGRWRVQMLEQEGIEVRNGKIVNFNDLFWDPSKEIE